MAVQGHVGDVSEARSTTLPLLTDGLYTREGIYAQTMIIAQFRLYIDTSSTSDKSARDRFGQGDIVMSHLFRVASLVATVVLLQSSPALAVDEPTRAYGGSGGAMFMDAPAGPIVGVRIRAGKYVDSIQLAYRTNNKIVWGRRHGGGGGQLYEIMFKNNERITEIGGRYGKYLDSVYIKTNKKTYPRRGGSGGGGSFSLKGSIKGVWGRSGALVDALGVIRTYSGSQQTPSSTKSLSGYQPSQGGDDKADSVTSIAFPSKNTSAGGLSNWLVNHNRRLHRTVENLAGTSAAMGQYEQRETGYCKGNVYCEIAYREDAIAYATGSQ